MPKYAVHMHKDICIDIEADDMEDARLAAWEHWDETDADLYLTIDCLDEEQET